MNRCNTTVCSSVPSSPVSDIGRLAGFLSKPVRPILSLMAPAERAAALLQAWSRRASDRRQLQSLDDHTLRDIGLSRSDVEYAIRRRFWHE